MNTIAFFPIYCGYVGIFFYSIKSPGAPTLFSTFLAWLSKEFDFIGVAIDYLGLTLLITGDNRDIYTCPEPRGNLFPIELQVLSNVMDNRYIQYLLEEC